MATSLEWKANHNQTPRVGVSCAWCEREFLAMQCRVREGGGRFCSKECSRHAKALIDPVPRFMARVHKTEGCWLWTGRRNEQGYGLFHHARKQHRAHRWIYEATKGPVPEGKYVCHTCDNPSCVRPTHLWAGTPQDNALDMVRKNRHARKGGRPRGT